MRVAPPISRSPRLLETAAAEWRASAEAVSGAKLARSSFLGSNGFAIFAGVALGALLICGVSTVLITRHAADEQVAPARLVPIAPVTPSALPEPAATPQSAVPAATAIPEPELPADALRVTSIALGHPRLAVINRQEVTEGDWVYVDTGACRVRLRLRVIRIADGRVELTLGRRVVAVPLAQMKVKSAR